MDKHSTQSDFIELVLLALQGEATPEQMEQLNGILKTEPNMVRTYVNLMQLYTELSPVGSVEISPATYDSTDYMTLMQLLAQEAKTAPGIVIEKPVEEPAEPAEPMRIKPVPIEYRKRRFPVRTFMMSAAMFLFAAVFIWLTPVPQPVAVLTDSINAEWMESEETPYRGQSLCQGPLTLTRGVAKITFNDGAVVVIEAPTVLELESPKSMLVSRGKVCTFVGKDAVGFTVNTPSGTIVDLGTEFGVNVEADGSSSLQMFQGKANLITGGKKRETTQTVYANEARRVDGISGQVRSIRFDRSDFIYALQSPYEDAVLKSSPSVYWRFEDDRSGPVMNSVDASRYNGAFFGNCRLDKAGPDLGNGELNTALLLDGQDSYVKFENVMPEGMTTCSIALWVRPDSDGPQNIFVCSDPEEGPEFNFSMQLRIGVNKHFEFYCLSERHEKGDTAAKFSIQADDTVQNGRWYFLTATVGENHEMRLYVDGELAASTMMKDKLFDRYPDIYVGCPAGNKRGYSKHKMGAFKGMVDEIAVFNRVLSNEEIQNMYRNTRP